MISRIVLFMRYSPWQVTRSQQRFDEVLPAGEGAIELVGWPGEHLGHREPAPAITTAYCCIFRQVPDTTGAQ
jgi:hypothetical protein